MGRGRAVNVEEGLQSAYPTESHTVSTLNGRGLGRLPDANLLISRSTGISRRDIGGVGAAA